MGLHRTAKRTQLLSDYSLLKLRNIQLQSHIFTDQTGCFMVVMDGYDNNSNRVTGYLGDLAVGSGYFIDGLLTGLLHSVARTDWEVQILAGRKQLVKSLSQQDKR